jgi:TPR repeat protein
MVRHVLRSWSFCNTLCMYRLAAHGALSAEASQGLSVAQYNLGRMYLEGRGVERDDAEAMRLFRLAEIQGHARATATLKRMHA